MVRPRTLRLEYLEDRLVPAVYGFPWADPTHLTLSFAPDGTPIAGQASNLFQALNGQLPTAVWERDVLLAAQTWAVNANLNISVVPDGGQPFGTAGSIQGDPRFGDIRIGGVTMSSNALAISVPNNPYGAGTWTGDILLNTATALSNPQTDLLAVMLHEIGHALGLPDSSDPHSVMYDGAPVPNTQLSPGDITSLQSLYGPRLPDRNEGSRGNNTLATAARLQPWSDDAPFDGSTPLVASGDVTTPSDADFFSLRTLPTYQGPITFQVETGGISLLEPRLTVYDATGNVLGQAQSTNLFGDTVKVTVPRVAPNTVYYARVDGASPDVLGIGRYGIAATYDSLLKLTATQIDSLLHGPSLSYSGGQDDSNVPSHQSPTTPLSLTTARGFPGNQHYDMIDGLPPGRTAYYRVQAPSTAANGTIILTATVNAVSSNGARPQIQLYDANQTAIAANLLVNNAGAYTIQATNLTPNASYFLDLVMPPSAHESEHSGTYWLIVDFTQPLDLIPTLASGTLTPTASQRTDTVYVAQDQLFLLMFSGNSPAAPAGTAVRMTVTDQNGVVVLDLTAPLGQPLTSNSVLLPPGQYNVKFSETVPTGSALGSVSFSVSGGSMSDPIGLAVSDPRHKGIYINPLNPNGFLYPGGVVSMYPFYWVAFVL
jgi:hypothetical protein